MNNDNSPSRGLGAGLRAGLPLVAFLLMTGCGLFERTSDFDKVAEERPLEIPPDLDRPQRSSMMAVPGADGDGTDGVRPLGNALVVEDTVASTWRRVGIALERAGLPIASQAESERAYVVDFVDEDAKEQRPGLFSRWILRRKGPEDLSGRYRLVVEPEDVNAATVSVRTESGSPAPRRVSEKILGALEGRLG